MRRETVRVTRGRLLREANESARVAAGPETELFDEFEGVLAVRVRIEATERVRAFSTSKGDGNASGGQGWRKRIIAGEGLGTKEGIFMGGGKVAEVTIQAGVEQAEKGLAFGGAEGAVTIVEEDGGVELVAVHAVGRGEQVFHDAVGGGPGDEHGIPGELPQQREADTFTGLRLG